MLRILALLLATVAISGCAEEGKYPISGEECHQGDPVQDMTPPDCALPTGAGTL